MDGAMAALLALLGLPILIGIFSIWRGYVLSVLWGWFAVPVFHFPTLSIPAAIGITLLVGFLTNHSTGNEAQKNQSAGEALLSSVIRATLFPVLALAIGWVVLKFQ